MFEVPTTRCVAEHVYVSVAVGLVRLYGQDESLSNPWSLFRLKQRFMVDMAHAQCDRIETRWQRKLLKLKAAA